MEVDGSLAQTNLPAAVSGNIYDAANELTAWNGATLSYDANGNMLSDVPGNQYTWDARNHLIGIGGVQTASFAYDPFGRRTSFTGGVQTRISANPERAI